MEMVGTNLILIIVLNAIILFGLVIYMRRLRQKQGKVNENRFAILACGWMSLLYITLSLPFLNPDSTRILLIMDAIYLLIIWSIGYLWFRWIGRKINSRFES